MKGKVKELPIVKATPRNFKQLIKKNRFCVLDFMATWCMPCAFVHPLIVKLAITCKPLKVIQINTDDNGHLVRQYNITSIPWLVFLKDGEVVGNLKGDDITWKKLSRMVKKHYNLSI